MEKDDQQHEQEQQDSAGDVDLLLNYMKLTEPVIPVISRSVRLLVLSIFAYTVFGFWVPDHPEFWHSLFSSVLPDYAQFELWIKTYMTVPEGQRWNRMMLLCYLSLYIGMWWAYFRSKKYPEGTEAEAKSLKIQSLRRLLGTTSKQWQPHAVSTSDDQDAIDAYRRKSGTSMQVIAVLIAVSILIFDQISTIWMMPETEFSVWQYGILWIGMLSAVISFICFMMCVDALDTVFNQFSSDPIRNVLVKFFYDYTLNPRYAGGAAMLFSVILLLGFHSEALASLAVITILLVGYNLWFPNVSVPLKNLGGITQTVSRKCYRWYITLLLLPLVIRMGVFFFHA
jgi:protein-S-isoprenylcysteine O-methyltransferase Ste14